MSGSSKRIKLIVKSFIIHLILAILVGLFYFEKMRQSRYITRARLLRNEWKFHRKRTFEVDGCTD